MMPFLGDTLKAVAFGVGIGVGVTVAAPFVFPGAKAARRPLVKRAMRAWMKTQDRLRECAEEAREQMSDVMAEIKAERDVAQRAREEAKPAKRRGQMASAPGGNGKRRIQHGRPSDEGSA